MEDRDLPFEQFDALAAFPWLQHAFTTRVPGLDVAADKARALRSLDRTHRTIRDHLGLGDMAFATAEQVHGNAVRTVADATNSCSSGVDGLITNRPGICLGIYVADCCAVFLLDRVHHAIGLLHSGKKGTELGIVGEGLRAMHAEYGTNTADVTALLSPCIRPPHYEIDFAGEIRAQLRQAGVVQIHDSLQCTACDPARYYSYRAEQGRTGRMLALLALRPELVG